MSRRPIVPTGRWTEPTESVLRLAMRGPVHDIVIARQAAGRPPQEPCEVFAQEGELFAVVRYCGQHWLLLRLDADLWRERRRASLQVAA